MTMTDKEMQMADDIVDEEVLRDACRNLAGILSLGLTRWQNALQWLAHYIATGSDEALTELRRYGTEVGLPIVTAARIAEVLHVHWRDASPELDLRPALPLAHALGESYVLFLIPETPEIADRLPVVAMERTRQLFTPSVRAWMAHHVDEVPEFRAAQAGETEG